MQSDQYGNPTEQQNRTGRNALIGTKVADVDIATDARPDRVSDLARAAGLRVVPTGIDHGTVTVIAGGIPHEVTSFRRDVETDGRRARVAFSPDLAEDAARRDFTMNALYAEAVLSPGAILPLDPDYDERAIYIVSGKVDIAGDEFGAGQLLVFKPGDRISILAIDQARVMIVGGEPMDGPRNIWWNFVSSSKERIEQAKHEWKTGRFDTVPGDESEFIPLPEG